jgi:hypothetical protein
MKDVPMSQWIRDIMMRQKARDEALANAVVLGTGAQVIAASMRFELFTFMILTVHFQRMILNHLPQQILRHQE